MKQKFFISFILLLLTSVIYMLADWQNNADLRAWWPIVLIISAFLYAVYAFIIVQIDKINPQSMLFFWLFNIFVSVILLGFQLAFAFYDFDMYAINEGIKVLTWYESILLNDWTMYILLIVSLCFYAVKVKFFTKSYQ